MENNVIWNGNWAAGNHNSIIGIPYIFHRFGYLMEQMHSWYMSWNWDSCSSHVRILMYLGKINPQWLYIISRTQSKQWKRHLGPLKVYLSDCVTKIYVSTLIIFFVSFALHRINGHKRLLTAQLIYTLQNIRV